MTVERQSGEWWARIAHLFSTHVREEVALLERYEQLVERTDDSGTRYLLELILADEHRHHAVFEQLTAAARSESSGTPPAPSPSSDVRAELLEASRRFLDLERADSRSLHELQRELKPAADQTLWRLLVDLMELDTRKHIHVLEYLVARLERLERRR